MGYPHIGNRFSVIIDDIELQGNFSSVSGLSAELEYEEYAEGGNFDSPVYLPKGVKYSNIVLQRGTVTDEPLSKWFADIQKGVFKKYPMIVTMMDGAGKNVRIWTVKDAMPVKVEYSQFDAMSDSVAITTIEMIHGGIDDEKVT